MKQKIIDGLIFIGAIITFPIWVICLIVILWNVPEPYYDDDSDHYYLP